MQHLDVPFVANTPDDLHCQQSAYAMIREYFEPGVHAMSYEEWCSLTGYEEGKGTWASSGLLWFKNNGYNVSHITLFDFAKFADQGAQYLTDEYGAETAEWQIKHSNLPNEQCLSLKLLENNIVILREPSFDDIRNALDSGSLLRAAINSSVLNGRDGYVGHAVVIVGYDDNGVVIHDPGLPPIENRHVDFATFEKAWAYPNEEAKELDIIRA